MTLYRTIFGSSCLLASLTIGAGQFVHQNERQTANRLAVITAYIQAIYARDFTRAYGLLSAADRRVQSEAGYVETQNAYHGFALEAATKLANYIEIWTLEHHGDDHRRRIKIGYRVPAPADLAGFLLNWDEAALDDLPRNHQQEILTELDARKRAGTLLFVAGQETFDLVKEQNDWKIFLDWAAAIKVRLKTRLANSRALEIRFAETELLIKDDEPFLVNLVVRNRSPRSLTFTVAHHVDPQSVAESLEMVECGLIAPITLSAGAEQEFSMAYLLGRASSTTLRQIGLTYEFKVK